MKRGASWPNGGAADSKSEGCGFESHRGQYALLTERRIQTPLLLPTPMLHTDRQTPAVERSSRAGSYATAYYTTPATDYTTRHYTTTPPPLHRCQAPGPQPCLHSCCWQVMGRRVGGGWDGGKGNQMSATQRTHVHVHRCVHHLLPRLQKSLLWLLFAHQNSGLGLLSVRLWAASIQARH